MTQQDSAKTQDAFWSDVENHVMRYGPAFEKRIIARAEGSYYGLGMNYEATEDGFRMSHAGALAIPFGPKTGAFAVVYPFGAVAAMAYDVPVADPARFHALSDRLEPVLRARWRLLTAMGFVGISLYNTFLYIGLTTTGAITAAMLYLVSADAPSRAIVSCAGGGYARAYVVETDGVYLPPGEQTPENIAARWEEISSTDNVHYYDTSSGPNMNFFGKAQAYAAKK